MTKHHHQPTWEMPVQLPIDALCTTVGEADIDVNGHMSSAAYFMAFQKGSARLLRPLGFDAAYRARGFLIFQRDIHIRYVREVRLGDEYAISTWLVGFDDRRIEHFHMMRAVASGEVAATAHIITVNISAETRRSAPFPDDIARAVKSLGTAFQSLPQPPGVDRHVELTGTSSAS